MSTLQIEVGLGSCGIAAGGRKVIEAFETELSALGIDCEIKEKGCIGRCYDEVLVTICRDGEETRYTKITPAKVKKLVADHVQNGTPVKGFQEADDGFWGKQVRIALRNAGRINPLSLDEYIENGGYDGLKKTMQMSGDEIIDMVTRSGLRGRGGGGFPTGTKWKFCRQSPGNQKTIICNGDEGDPGAFMDRSIMEGDPHSVLEGMAIAGHAIGADTGIVYVRAEYPMAVRHLKHAVIKATEQNLLGEKILGTDFSFKVYIKEGAGAFVCGEETALIASVEGERGMPRIRPPYPAVSGYLGKPTNINNVETYANIPWILSQGHEAYYQYGFDRSRGTKVFALAGRIKRGGLVEVPMGITLREVIFDVGGGISTGKKFKGVQLGGPSGGCVPESLLDTPVGYETIVQTGAIMGSGGMVVMDETTCMVDIARFFLGFTQDESCGKCTFCRIGTKRMLEILNKICDGHGTLEDVAALEQLAQQIKKLSLCGLGQTAPNPVLSTLRYFREEYIAHVEQHHCPAGVCKPLCSYQITETCTGCHACVRACPTGAISGTPKNLHIIDSVKCVKCGECNRVCRFDAVAIGKGVEA